MSTADTSSRRDSASMFIVGGRVKSTLDPENRQTALDHVASILQVQNLVVLFGSGASFHLGSPKTRALNNASIAELIGDTGGELLSGEEESLLSTLNPTGGGDIEQLLDVLQLSVAFAERTGQDEVHFTGAERPIARETLTGLLKKINIAFAQACRLPQKGFGGKDPYRAHRDFLSRMVRGRRGSLPRPRLFTTNYDLVIERALDQLGYPYIDGFVGTVDRRLDIAAYGLDFHMVESATQRALTRAENAVYLHKVHGSLNWRTKGVTEPASGLEILEVLQVPDGPTTESDGSVLIYPTASKEGDTLSFPYADLMRLLGEAVQLPNTAIVTVGYGYNDAHINRLLLRGLTTNPAIHFLIADPFGVFEDPKDLAQAAGRPDILAVDVAELDGLSSSAIANLARSKDSRIAVLTGELGKFTELASLLPDTSVADGFASAAALPHLVNSLKAAISGTSGDDGTIE